MAEKSSVGAVKSGSGRSWFTLFLEIVLIPLAIGIVLYLFHLSTMVGELKGSLSGVSKNAEKALDIAQDQNATMRGLKESLENLKRIAKEAHRLAQGLQYQQVVEEESDQKLQNKVIEDCQKQENVHPFESIYKDKGIMKLFGPCRTPIVKTKLSQQFFQKGSMFWRLDRWKIYVLYHDQQLWNVYQDTWASMKEISEKLDIPEGVFEPEGGFRKIWIEKNLERTLGWPIEEEHSGFDGYVQDFEKGFLIGPVSQGPQRIYPPDGFVYAFLEEGMRYEKFDFPEGKSK